MTPASAIAGPQALAGVPREVRSPLNMEAMRIELKQTYGIRLSTGAPSWRGASAATKQAPPPALLLNAPHGITALIDGHGGQRPIIEGKIWVSAEDGAALLQAVGWTTA